MRRTLIVTAALIASGLPAVASGSLDCTIKDKAVQLEAHAGVTRGMGGPFFSFEAELTISAPSVPADFKAVKFEMKHLAQRWLNDREAKLVIYRERDGEPHGSVEIAIETKRISKDDEGSYAGIYVLEVHTVAAAGKPEPKPIKLRGKVACSAE